MPIKIPWESIGPAASLLVIVLVIVFAFILKFNKQTKVNSSALPKPTDTLGKKTLCFSHESRISSNKTMISEMKNQQETQRKENRQDHEKLFGKIDDMGTKIITEISKNSSP